MASLGSFAAPVSPSIAVRTRSVTKSASMLGLNSLKRYEYTSRMTRKMALRGLAFAVGTVLATTVAFAPAANASNILVPDTEYQTVFDGTAASFQKNWVPVTPASGRGGYTLPGNGTMQSVPGGLGGLWLNLHQYGDFSIKLEWRDDSPLPLAGNSGVLTRFPVPSTGLLSCLNKPTCGYEIQVNDSPDRDPRITGSVYGFQDNGVAQGMVTPRGTWNTYQVQVVGEEYTITRNGVVINDYLSIPGLTFGHGEAPSEARPTDPGSSGRKLSGYVGIQFHGDANDVVSYRNVQIADVGPSFDVVRSYINQAQALGPVSSLGTLTSDALTAVATHVDQAEKLFMGGAADQAVRAELVTALQVSGTAPASRFGQALVGLAAIFNSGLPTDISPLISIKSGLLGGGASPLQSMAIMNVSPTSIDGPLYVAIDGLANGVTLANASGIVANVQPAGVPYFKVLDAGQSLAVNQSALAVLHWSTSGPAISYSARVLAGPGAP
jgi:Domain of Unknown Function (DUF1080)